VTERDPLARARTRRLDRAIAEAHVLVTTGAGGVGKTTTAAALGLAAAAAGRRTLVLTIDPAKRLAQALGVDLSGDRPNRIELDAPGELWATMLDMQRTFDELVDERAPTAERAAAIKANPVYRTLASTLSGTHEYMAMEKLHALHAAGEWDLLVIDTPPTRNALDFLDAPKRMTGCLEGRLLDLLMRPGFAGGKGLGRVVGFGATAFMRLAGKVTGMELLEDLAQFFRSFEGMYGGFKERAEQVLVLLRRPDSQFVVVSSPQPPPLREARFFLERLEQEGLHTAGMVVNRVHPVCAPEPSDRALEQAAASQPDDTEGRALAGALRLLIDTRHLGYRERRDVAAALRGLRPPALIEVPLLHSDVHDLSSLRDVAAALTGAA